MGYPENFKVVTKFIADNIITASTAFTRFDKINFGARMAVFNYKSKSNVATDNLIIWSPLPYGSQVEEVLTNFVSGNSGEQPSTNQAVDFDSIIKYVVIPDREHNMAAKTYKEKFPNCKLIGMENIDYGTTKIDYIFKKSMGNVLFKDSNLKEIIDDEIIYDNFEFVYLPDHANQELVLYEKNSRSLFEADLLFNLGDSNIDPVSKSKLEQFSPNTGYPVNFNPHSGWSYLTRYLQPYSKVGRFMFRFLVNVGKSRDGLKLISQWDFDKIIMCHGNIITKDAKKAFVHDFTS